jgi:hypothetical protein
MKVAPWPVTALAWSAFILPARSARALDEAPVPPCLPSREARREAVIALGYGSLILPRGLPMTTIAGNAEKVSAIGGLSIDVAQRISAFEYGARFFTTGGSSDGRGSSAHVLTRLVTEGRFYPWPFRTLEPWIGAELGLALADDFAIWNKTERESAHRAVGDVRPGFVAGLEAGARLHLTSLFALGARAGALYMAFDRAGGPVRESAETTTFFVQPADYGRNVWLTVALTAELTVAD